MSPALPGHAPVGSACDLQRTRELPAQAERALAVARGVAQRNGWDLAVGALGEVDRNTEVAGPAQQIGLKPLTQSTQRAAALWQRQQSFHHTGCCFHWKPPTPSRRNCIAL